MILGIGTDIIEIDRIDKAIRRNKNFLIRNFSKEEYLYFESRKFKMETIAGSFSSKEATSKAIGTGFRGFSLIDIEVVRDDFGKPNIKISKKIEDILACNGIKNYKFHLSIAHNKETAIAYVILEGDKDEAL
ncbi:MAG: holo-ACP synthase [Sarcina sp.]